MGPSDTKKSNGMLKIMFVLIKNLFLEQFKVHSKIKKKCRKIPHMPLCIASSIINSSHQSGTFVIIDTSILTHHNYSRSIVSIEVHSCCTSYAFEQMDNDMYPSFLCYTKYFHCPKNHLCFAYFSFFPLPNSWKQ